MTEPECPSLKEIFTTQIGNLAATLQPATLNSYRTAVNSFLRYLQANHPETRTLSALRREPHILGWMRSLREQQLRSGSRLNYLVALRRLLMELARSGEHSIATGLVERDDFPPHDRYLPKPLSPEDDTLLEQYLRRQDDLRANAFLLLRKTGLRISEFLNLPVDCLRHLGEEQWALHVPLGKLHTDRLVPIDDEIRHIHSRILQLRQYRHAAACSAFLVPRLRGQGIASSTLRNLLVKVGQEAGCATRVTPHRLRHSYATEMLRAGMSLPAVMELLGHKYIGMTLRYVKVSQTDLQRQYHLARQNLAGLHSVPKLLTTTEETQTGLPAITKTLLVTRHLLDMHRRQLTDQQVRRKLERLANRLSKIAAEVRRLDGPEN